MDRMGHAQIQTTQKYLHTLPDTDQKNLDALTRIAGAGSPSLMPASASSSRAARAGGNEICSSRCAVAVVMIGASARIFRIRAVAEFARGVGRFATAARWRAMLSSQSVRRVSISSG